MVEGNIGSSKGNTGPQMLQLQKTTMNDQRVEGGYQEKKNKATGKNKKWRQHMMPSGRAGGQRKQGKQELM